MHWSPEAIVSLLATVFVAILFALMVNGTWALASGRDPMADQVRVLSRRFPQGVFALAVVLGLVLGHLLWP